MSECLFCNIVDGSIPSDKVWEGEDAIAFRDINPKAPTHVVVVPKKHIASIADIQKHDEPLMGSLMYSVSEVARTLDLTQGYKIIINVGTHGGQVIDHLHIHILGGKKIRTLV